MQHKTLTVSVARKTLLVAVLFAGFVVHVLSWRHLGIQTPLSSALLIAALLFLFSSDKRKIHPSTYVLLCLAQALSLGVAFRLSEGLQAFTFIAVMLLLAAAGVNQMRPLLWGIKDFALQTLLLPIVGLAMIGSTVSQSKLNQSLRLSQRHTAVIRGVLISLPILIVFGLLFASADEVFKNLFKDIPGLTEIGRWLFSVKQFMFVFVAVTIGGMLSYVLAVKATKAPQAKTAPLYGVELSVLLGLLNVLFAVFVVIQAVYLFGGRDFVLGGDLTYADYGRRGFFELVWVSLGVYVIGYFAHSNNIGTGSSRNRYLLYALVAQVGIIIVSALKRLSLYESAYGLSELRVYSHLFVFVIVISFILLLAAIRFKWSTAKVAYGLVVLLASYMLLINWVNVPALIARSNATKPNESGILDTYYIMRLPADASAEQVKLIKQMPESNDKQALLEYLCMYASSLNDTGASRHWSAYHFARAEALKNYESVGCTR